MLPSYRDANAAQAQNGGQALPSYLQMTNPDGSPIISPPQETAQDAAPKAAPTPIAAPAPAARAATPAPVAPSPSPAASPAPVAQPTGQAPSGAANLPPQPVAAPSFSPPAAPPPQSTIDQTNTLGASMVTLPTGQQVPISTLSLSQAQSLSPADQALAQQFFGSQVAITEQNYGPSFAQNYGNGATTTQNPDGSVTQTAPSTGDTAWLQGVQQEAATVTPTFSTPPAPVASPAAPLNDVPAVTPQAAPLAAPQPIDSVPASPVQTPLTAAGAPAAVAPTFSPPAPTDATTGGNSSGQPIDPSSSGLTWQQMLAMPVSTGPQYGVDQSGGYGTPTSGSITQSQYDWALAQQAASQTGNPTPVVGTEQQSQPQNQPAPTFSAPPATPINDVPTGNAPQALTPAAPSPAPNGLPLNDVPPATQPQAAPTQASGQPINDVPVGQAQSPLGLSPPPATGNGTAPAAGGQAAPIPLSNLGSVLEQNLGSPSSYDTATMQAAMQNELAQLQQSEDQGLAGVDADSASRGLFYGSGNVVDRDKIRQQHDTALSQYATNLMLAKAGANATDIQNSIQNAFQFTDEADKQDTQEQSLAALMASLGLSGAPTVGDAVGVQTPSLGGTDLASILKSIFGA